MEDDDLICGRKRPTMDDLSSTEDDDQLLTCLTFDQDALPEHFTGPRLHQLLRKVDPAMADAIHPNNRRKIIRWDATQKIIRLNYTRHRSGVAFHMQSAFYQLKLITEETARARKEGGETCLVILFKILCSVAGVGLTKRRNGSPGLKLSRCRHSLERWKIQVWRHKSNKSSELIVSFSGVPFGFFFLHLSP